MKILMCHNYYQQRGGEDESFDSECRLLESRGHEVVRYTRHNDDIRAMRAWTVARRTLFNAGTRLAVGALLHEERPDVVHCTNIFPLISPAVYAAAHAAGVPVVQSVRNYRHVCANGYLFRAGTVCEDCLGRLVAWPGVVRGCYRGSRAGSAVVAALQLAERMPGSWTRTVRLFFTPTEFARRKLVQAGLPAARITVKPNFLDVDPGVGAGRGAYFVFVGRLSPEKGVETLLEAWAGMVDAPRLVLMGDGPLADRVQQAAERDLRIEWRGRCPQAEVLALVADAAGLVCPSTWYETFGRTVMEAYATGTPVIASEIGALAELVEHERTGLRFAPGDVAGLQDAVRRLWWSVDERARMRLAARAKYEREFTAEANHRQLLAIYERALGRTGAAVAVRAATGAVPSGTRATRTIESTGEQRP